MRSPAAIFLHQGGDLYNLPIFIALRRVLRGYALG